MIKDYGRQFLSHKKSYSFCFFRGPDLIYYDQFGKQDEEYRLTIDLDKHFDPKNLKVHFCENGNGYMVHERSFLPEVNDGSVVKKQVHVE